jgi:hypothetical protein
MQNRVILLDHIYIYIYIYIYESPYGHDALQNMQFTASNRDAPHQQDTKYKIDRKTP